ncbi:MAG: MATE family efflux transporter [Tannerella sp.]|jgi:putative MATE family efflux protein|nr:MATE family efflux transporter [Tannerella sp.]
MENRRLEGDLTYGKVWKVILAFVFPLLIGNLLQQTYQVVDSIIVGRFLGKEALAAVSASFFIYYFIISLVIGVGSGITVVISQFYGSRQYGKVQLAFSSFLIFTFISGILLSVVGIVFAESFFRLTKVPEDVVPEAVRYFRVYMCGTPFFVTFNSFLSVMRGMGDSKRPMMLILVTAVLNIVFDILFILYFKWDMEGVAFATVLAQGAGVFMSVFFIHRRRASFSLPLPLSLKWKDLKFDRSLFLRGLKIGLPTSVQQCSLSIGLLALLGIVNIFGTDTLTAYGAAGKIDTLITQFILSLSSAMAAFCGQNMGAGHMSRIRQGVRFAMLINVLFSVGIYIIICLFGRGIMKVFSLDEVVISIGYDYLLIVGAVFFLHGALNVMNGAMRGAGDTLFAMVTGIVLFWFIRIPLAGFLSRYMGYKGIWLAITISITVGFIATYIYYKSEIWKRKKIA